MPVLDEVGQPPDRPPDEGDSHIRELSPEVGVPFSPAGEALLPSVVSSVVPATVEETVDGGLEIQEAPLAMTGFSSPPSHFSSQS